MWNFYRPRREQHPENFTPLGRGMSSVVYRHGDTVVKISRQARSEKATEAIIRILQSEYDTTRRYLGDVAVDTSYLILADSTNDSRFRVVSKQPYIEGTPVAATTHPNKRELVALYDRALDMYDTEGWIPDLACIEHGFFDASQSPNLLHDPSGGLHLIDANRGRIQRSKVLGGVWNFYISEAVKRSRMDFQEDLHKSTTSSPVR